MSTRAQRRQSFAGRDPDEEHRSATLLEVLYDLTFVVAFGTGHELARYLADGHVWTAILGFAICLARGRLGLDQLLVVRVRL